MDELGDRNGYLELSNHPIRFEPVSKVTNVFFDDTSKEVRVYYWFYFGLWVLVLVFFCFVIRVFGGNGLDGVCVVFMVVVLLYGVLLRCL